MNKRRQYLKLLILTLLFLVFGFFPLSNSGAITKEASSLPAKEPESQCSEILKISKNNQASLETLERLVGYLEGSVKDIQ